MCLVLSFPKGETLTSPKDIAKTMNHELLSKVAKAVRSIKKTDTDPLINYTKVMENKTCQFQLNTITMSQLMKSITSMKTSHSAGSDGISTFIIKKCLKQLQSPILNLVNQSISTKKYSKHLKEAKVISLYKVASPPKPVSEPSSYRGINLIMSLGKITDKVVLQQLLSYLLENSLVHEAYHRSIKGRSTATAVTTLMDTWTNKVENGDELAAIALDLSAAYDLIDHNLLLKKMQVLGFQQETLDYFASYLSDRTQVVYMDGVTSDSLHIGNRSVIQGSVMLCALYLIYIIDMPVIFHTTMHSMEETDKCVKPALQTFVDDAICTVTKQSNMPLQQSVDATMETIGNYMQVNHLALNRDKTQLLILNRDPPPFSPKLS